MKRFLIFLIVASSVFLSSCAKKDVVTSTAPSSSKTVSGENYKIGVILPLTGKYSLYGGSTLHGIECGAGIFAPCDGLIKAELVIKDDEGISEKAVQAVEDLVNIDKVSIIIGPLSSSSIGAAAGKAQELGIPLISLSQKEGITSLGDNIFSVALTAELQVKQVAEWAVKTKKLKTFAAVYPNNPYGTLCKDLFINAVKDLGGRVLLIDKYGESSPDLGGIFRKSEQKFDAIFIPDSYRAVAYISSVMAAEGIENVQFLGINRWNNEALIEQSGDLIQGAVFVDGFFEKNQNRDTRVFVSSFEGAYALKPTILEAQAFDAARLASRALLATGGAHAADVKAELSAGSETEGSTGPVGFDSKREISKKLFLLTIKEDKIVEMEDPTNRKDSEVSPGTHKY